MEPDQSTRLGAKRGAILVSGKFRNNVDGLIWPTKGRSSALSGHRYTFFVVGQTKAESMPRQQTRKIGQMIQYGPEVL